MSAGILPMPYLKEQNNRCEDECDDVGYDDRQGTYRKPIKRPEKNTNREHHEHAQRNIPGRMCLPGLYDLGQEGERSECACCQAEQCYRIHRSSPSVRAAGYRGPGAFGHCTVRFMTIYADDINPYFMISAVKTNSLEFFHPSLGSPALSETPSRKASLLQRCSRATCGRSSPVLRSPAR